MIGEASCSDKVSEDLLYKLVHVYVEPYMLIKGFKNVFGISLQASEEMQE